MAHCEDWHDCHGHGDCVDSLCSCDVGWFDDDCSTPGSTLWGRSWAAFRALFAISYFLLSAWTIFRIRKSAKVRMSALSVRAIIATPKYMSLCWLVVAGSFRGLWLAVDPLTFKDLSSRLADRLLYETVFPMLYVGYTNVLLVWYSYRRVALYQGVRQTNKDHTRLYRWLLVAFMVASFPASIAISILKGMRTVQSSWLQLGYIFMCVGVGIIITGLCLFAVLLTLALKNQAMEEDQESLTIDNTVTMQNKTEKTIGPIETAPQTTERSLDEEQLQPAIERCDVVIVQRKRLVTTASPFSLASRPSDHVSTHQWSLSSGSSSEVSPSRYEWSLYGSQLPAVRSSLSPSVRYVKATEVKEKYFVAISGKDTSVLRKIIVMTVTSAVIGVIVVLLSVFFTTIHSIRHPYSILAVLWGISLMEIAVLVMITLIFTIEIKVKSKENLLFVSDLARKLDKMKATFELSPYFHRLTTRFNSYLGMKPS